MYAAAVVQHKRNAAAPIGTEGGSRQITHHERQPRLGERRLQETSHVPGERERRCDQGAGNNDDGKRNVQVNRHDIRERSHVQQNVQSQQPSQQPNGRFDSGEGRGRGRLPSGRRGAVAGRAIAVRRGGDGGMTVGLVGFNAS